MRGLFVGLRRRIDPVDHRLPAASVKARGDDEPGVAQQALGGHHHQRQGIHGQ